MTFFYLSTNNISIGLPISGSVRGWPMGAGLLWMQYKTYMLLWGHWYLPAIFMSFTGNAIQDAGIRRLSRSFSHVKEREKRLLYSYIHTHIHTNSITECMRHASRFATCRTGCKLNTAKSIQNVPSFGFLRRPLYFLFPATFVISVGSLKSDSEDYISWKKKLDCLHLGWKWILCGSSGLTPQNLHFPFITWNG